jgi:hypothetical protein
MFRVFDHLFNRRRNKHSSRVHRRRSSRRLAFDRLESRELLSANPVANGSFETPVLPTGTYQYSPAGSAWSYATAAGTNGAGISAAGSYMTSGDIPTSDGAQVGFVQGTGNMSQDVDLPAGAYTLSLIGAQRYNTSPQILQVSVDGTPIGKIQPYSYGFLSYETPTFNISATGEHQIQITGLNAGDTALIDGLSIDAAPSAIIDGSFEVPGIPMPYNVVAPVGSAWQFSATSPTGMTGVITNGSSLLARNAPAPDGTQVAFVEGNGSISEQVDLNAGSYTLSMLGAQICNGVGIPEALQVNVDGHPVGLIQPYAFGYLNYQTSIFNIAASGLHTVQITGQIPNDFAEALIDDVSISTAPTGIIDGSFETPGVPMPYNVVAPVGSAWQFSGTTATGMTGVITNGSPLLAHNASAPDGTQVAFVEGNGSISEQVDLNAGVYTLSMLGAQISNGAGTPQVLEVTVDGQQAGSVEPYAFGYLDYQTPIFNIASSGLHTIQIEGQLANKAAEALIDEVSITAAPNGIIDGSFEVPGIPTPYNVVAPVGSAWQFSGATTTGMAGVITNGSSLLAGNAPAPDGTQVAFVEGNGSISEQLNLNAGLYTLSMLGAQIYNAAPQGLEVNIDGKQVGSIKPYSNNYVSYSTPVFKIATSGLHTIEICGATAGDGTDALIDKLSINVAPTTEPTADSGTFYAPVSGTLFGASGPGFADVYQGAVGDCWLLASLAEVAARDPQDIRNMFTYVGTSVNDGVYVDTYSVRFFNSAGVAEYVAVDTELPDFGEYYDHVENGVLWVALAEKAYAEANGAGYVTTSQTGIGSYAALNVGAPAWALQAITGGPASEFAVNPPNVASAWNAGDFVVLGTESPVSQSLVPDHDYALVNYLPTNTTPFELFNPLGVASLESPPESEEPGAIVIGWAPESNDTYGLFCASAAYVSQNFSYQAIGMAASGVPLSSQTTPFTNDKEVDNAVGDVAARATAAFCAHHSLFTETVWLDTEVPF